MIERWNSEIDTYLVYAGLFSAIVTAFNVQSYLLLQPAPPDPAVVALRQISLQLSSLSISPSFANSTYPPVHSTTSALPPGPPVGASIVWLNALWFSSLVLSLSSASIGIMIKQWTNEFKSGLPSEKISREARETRDTARLRQYRLNNLVKWRVGAIVLAIPVFLQLALAFFLAGLLVLAWTLHSTVAAITTLFVAVLAIFTLVTMLLPSFKSSCAYLSPQGLVLDTIFQSMRCILCRMLHGVVGLIWRCACHLRENTGVHCKPVQLVERISWSVILWCSFRGQPVRIAPPRTWRTREKEVIAKSSESLDSDLLTMAYDTSLADPNILDAAARCLADAKGTTVIQAFGRLHAIAADHIQVDILEPLAWRVVESAKPSTFVLWWNTMFHMLATPPSIFTESSSLKSALTQLKDYLQRIGYDYSPDWNFGVLSATMRDVDRFHIEDSASDSILDVNALAEVARAQLEVDSEISGKAIGYIVAAVNERLRDNLNMESWNELIRSTMLVHVLVKCRTRMLMASDASEDHRETLCMHTQEVLGEYGAALGNVHDYHIVTWFGLYKLEMLLLVLRKDHMPSRPLVRMEFISAIRNFLHTVNSQSDLDDDDRSEVKDCESALSELESQIQSDSPLSCATESPYSPAAVPTSSSRTPQSHPVQEQPEGNSHSSRPYTSDHNDSNPERTTSSSPTGVTHNSAAGAASASLL
ncbi:hypothetical protein BV20DRAFT_148506 [Pilatotrama ljubarskyi]|nr:hypothetical protein BV20DRAFT_148506 [Pilatotrama ljubarskyi]